jgi:hypothetical protein
MNEIVCHFWNTKKSSDDTGASCDRIATTFIRIKATKRLCPLCTKCVATYEAAFAALSEAAREHIPGGGVGERVSIETGADEFAKQPSREEFEKTHPKSKADVET